MAGEDVEIGIDELHIDGHVGDGLCAIDQDASAVAVGDLGHFGDGDDGAQRVGDMGDGDEPGAGIQEFFIFFENDLAGAVDGGDAEACAFF